MSLDKSTSFIFVVILSIRVFFLDLVGLLPVVSLRMLTHCLNRGSFKTMREGTDVIILDSMLLLKAFKMLLQLMDKHLQHSIVKLKCSLEIPR
jgi:hypothetical protein